MRGRAVPDQKDALALPGVLFGECVEESLHALRIQARQDEPEDAPRLRMCRRIEPEPFVALIDLTEWSLSKRCPDAARDRLETEASFVRAPDFSSVRRVRFLKSLRFKFYLFLNSACSSKDARRLFAGRGTWRLKPSRRMARQAVEG